MVITQPTIDDFSDTTVMRVIRNMVKWIQTVLVPQINDNDIVSANLDFDDESRKLSGILIKGDGDTIDIEPVTIPGGSGTSIDYSIKSIEFTYKGNNLSCVITQNDGTQTTSNSVVIAGGGGTGGNPYPTDISGTVGEDGNITLKMTMSEGNPVTATINMSYFASADDLSDLQKQVSGIKPTVTINENVTPPTITVGINGKTAQANLPQSGNNVRTELTADWLSQLISAKEGSMVCFKRIKFEGNEYIGVLVKIIDPDNKQNVFSGSLFSVSTTENEVIQLVIVNSEIMIKYRLESGALRAIGWLSKTEVTNVSGFIITL